MARAGTAVAHAAAEWLTNPRGRRLLVLAGKGNNGGDALIAARVLWQAYGARPMIYLVGERAADPLLAWARDAGLPVAAHSAEQAATLRQWLAEADVVLDGILGIGGRLPVHGAAAEVLLACSEGTAYGGRATSGAAGQRRIAVDVPTGVQSDTGQADERAFRADYTLSTGPAKPGHFIHPGAAYAGRVRALDIGLAADLLAEPGPQGRGAGGGVISRAEAADVARLLPERIDESHKGTYGKVLVIAGSSHYVGAAYLAAAAAVRGGAGLVTLAVPQLAQQALAGRSAETTFLPLPDDPAAPGCLTPGHLGALLQAARTYDAVVLGPGLGSDPATQRLVALLAEHLAADGALPPLLVDADGLNALAVLPEWPRPGAARWVLTPHPGEMGRLSGRAVREVQSDRLHVALAHAQQWGQVVLLKGAPSIVAAPDGRACLNAFANAALAAAGTGDVLSGVIGALLAQGRSPYEAAVAGAYVHGLAGEFWRAEHGAAGLPASHLLESVPRAQQHVRGLR
jgi:NAD(P)H-hydrate epimerase